MAFDFEGALDDLLPAPDHGALARRQVGHRSVTVWSGGPLVVKVVVIDGDPLYRNGNERLLVLEYILNL